MKSLMALYLFLICTAASVQAQERDGVTQSRELQLLWVKSGFEIGVDTDPAWTWHSISEEFYDVFVIESPEFYYPPATINVRYNKFLRQNAYDFQFKKTAYFTISEIQKKYGAVSGLKFNDLIEVQYGELRGFEQTSIVQFEGTQLQSKVFVGLNSENILIVLNATTLPDKMQHLQPVLNRFWRSIKFLQSTSVDK